MTIADILSAISPLVQQIEGPYKWYIIAGVTALLTALITRFIFKTFKWFLLFILLTACAVGVIWTLSQLAAV